MSTIAFPLGFEIKGNSPTADSGQAIDARQVFASLSDRTNYTSNFFYRGLLNYTIGEPYHVSGVTSNSGFWTRYYNGATYSWQGLDASSVDDKHAYGTMDSTSNATGDPTTGTNITDHVNYLYTLYSGIVAGSKSWRDPVADVTTTVPTLGAGDIGKRYAINGVGTGAWTGHDGDIATWDNSTPWTFEDPSANWTVINDVDSKPYVYNASLATYWTRAGADIPNLSSSVSGIVSSTWYTDLYDFVTNTSNYANQNSFASIIAQNNGSGISGSPISASTPTSSLTLNLTGSLTGSISGSTLTIHGTGGGTTITSSANQLIYNNGSTITGTAGIESDGEAVWFKIAGSTISNTLSNMLIGKFGPIQVFDPDWGETRYDSITIGDMSALFVQDDTSTLYHNNLLIGHCAGSKQSETSHTGKFIVSSGFTQVDKNVYTTRSDIRDFVTAYPTALQEYRLLDGTFPVNDSESTYGDLRIRGIVYFKETSTYIDSLDNGTTRDLTFYDTHTATPVTLYELVNNNSSSLTASNGLTRVTNDFKLGGTLTGNTQVSSGTYSLTLSTNGLGLNGGTSGASISGNTFSFTIGTNMPATYSSDVSSNVLLDNDIPSRKFVVDYVTANAGGVITGGASTIVTSDLTASRALASNALGKVVVSATTSTELGYVSGVTSAIQTQLNAKEPSYATGSTAQYYRGDKSWQTLNTTAVTEGSNLYFTGTRVRDYLLTKGTPTNGYVLGTTGSDVAWVAQTNMAIADGVLDWDAVNLLYKPYSVRTSGCLYSEASTPSHSDYSLSYDGNFYAYNMFASNAIDCVYSSVSQNITIGGLLSMSSGAVLINPAATNNNYYFNTSAPVTSGNLFTVVNNSAGTMLSLDYLGTLNSVALSSSTSVTATTSITAGTTSKATTYFLLGTKWRFSIGTLDELQFEYSYDGVNWIVKANIEI